MMGEFWVFGYGSLMWRPGFAFLEQVPARLNGLHRSLCVYSHVHRGTPERPGLVLGLDRGGACRGVAFRVDPRERIATIDYLRAREQVTMVYREVERAVELVDGSGRRPAAVCYIVDRQHEQYAGALPLERQTAFIRQGHGVSGPNDEYLENTLSHLRQMGIRDRGLEALAGALREAASGGDVAASRRR